jgi:polyisoprenoid-binding protein YceI
MKSCRLLWIAAWAGAAQAQTYQLDAANSFVQFEVRHFDTSTLRGRFGPLRGEVMFDPAAQRGKVALAIDMNTLNTGFKPLDSRLKEPDLLDISTQPMAYFVAERFRFEAGRLVEVRGEFTLRGVGVPLSLRAQRFVCLGEPPAPRRCGGDFEGELRRSEFGATFGLPFIADSVRLRLQVEATQVLAPELEQAPPAAP